MEERVRAQALGNRRQAGGVADVGLDQLDALAEGIVRFSRRPVEMSSTIVTSVAARDQRVDEIRADETGAACDQSSQGAGS